MLALLLAWRRLIRRTAPAVPPQEEIAAAPEEVAEEAPASPAPRYQRPISALDITFTDVGVRTEDADTARPFTELEPELKRIAAEVAALKENARASGRRYKKSPDTYLAVVNLWAKAYTLLDSAWVIDDGRVMRLRNPYAEKLAGSTHCLPVSYGTFREALSDQRIRLIRLWLAEGLATSDQKRGRNAHNLVNELLQKETAALAKQPADAMHALAYGYMVLWHRYGRNFKRIEVPIPLAAWLIGDLAKRVAGADVPAREIPEEAVLVLSETYGKSQEAVKRLLSLRKGGHRPEGHATHE